MFDNPASKLVQAARTMGRWTATTGCERWWPPSRWLSASPGRASC